MELGPEPAAAGGQHAPFGVGEAGEVGVKEVVEGLLDEIELRGPVGGDGPQGGGPLVGDAGLGGSRVAPERLAGDVVRGGAVGGQERLGLPGGERVAGDDLDQAHLVRLGEGTQRERRGEREAAPVETLADLGGEAAGQDEAALDPPFLVAQQPGDGADGEAVLVGQGGGDAGLVHGAGRLGGRVGLEEPGLEGDAGSGLDDDGDLATPLGSPAGQALEAVEDLVEAVSGGGDTERLRGQGCLALRSFAAQGGQGGFEALEGEVEDEGGHGESSRGRSWKRG